MMNAVTTLYTYGNRHYRSGPVYSSSTAVVVIDGSVLVTIEPGMPEVTRAPIEFPGSLPFRLSSSLSGLVFECQGRSSEIWTMYHNGKMRLLASGSHARWSPAGGAIAFVGGTANRMELFVMRPAGIPYWSVASDCHSRSTVSWSPNGNQLVYVNSNNYISIVGIDGSDSRILVPHSVRGGWWCWGDNPEWSPRGDLIAYGQRSSDRHVLVVSLDGSLVQKHLGFDMAIWSPDGDRLICTNDEEIHVVDVNSGNPRFLTKGSLPAWSRDGKRVVFVNEESIHVIQV